MLEKQAIRTLCHNLAEYRNGFPNDYLVLDCETTGFKKEDDLIWNFGLLRIKDGQIAHEHDVVLNWTLVPDIIPESWLRAKIARQQEHMSKRGCQSKLTWNRLTRGVRPDEGMELCLSLMEEARRDGVPFVGHGIIGFDIPRIAFQLEEWIGAPWRFGKNEVIDTAVIEKALVTGVQPTSGEPFFDFAKRMAKQYAGKGVCWNLDGHCADKYELWPRSGLHPEDAHGALADCKLNHHLLQAYRELFCSEVTT